MCKSENVVSTKKFEMVNQQKSKAWIKIKTEQNMARNSHAILLLEPAPPPTKT